MRSVLVCVVPALVVTASWLRLEEPQRWPRTLALVALALVPSLAPRAWQRVAALTIATVAAADLATRASVRHPLHLAGYAARHFWRGLNDFYAVRLPFDPSFRPDMHLVLLAAAFGFVAALGLAARRPVAAVFVVLVGAGWPATLLGGHDLLRGAAILGAALLLLSGFRGRAVVAGVALAGLALAAATQPAVARDELLHWQRWNIARHVPTVGVRYVWDAQYDGFTWPRKVTTVFVVKAPPTSVYWRATVLDAFDGTRWHERLQPAHPAFLSGKLDVTQGDALYPPAAGDPARWRQSEFDIRALADDHVVTPSGVAAYGAVPHDPSFARGGIATVQGGLQRGDDYTVWSYEPQPTPRQLARTPAVYPRAIAHDLQLPNPEHAFAVVAHKIAGDAQTPYGAALALESWFRSTGGFTYTQHPPKAAHTLAGFLRVKAGYCQHFAGAMAVMLRTLGVPARVAEGFVSGTYDPSTQTWTVTDHDAHAWVEAWFAGYGWLPFDPTPGRGSLSAPYSVSSPNFRVASVASIVHGVAASLLNTAAIHQDVGFGEKGAGLIGGSVQPQGSTAHGASLGRLLALVVLALLAALGLAKLARRRMRYATRDPRRLAAACRAELVDFLADQRIAVAASAAPADLARVVRGELEVDARGFADALAAARYGPPAQARAAAARTHTELASLRARIRGRLGRVRRARGFVSLRSLGVR